MESTPIKDRVFSLLRHIITFVGAFFIGRQFLGNVVDDSLIETVAGVLLTIGGIVWSIFEKNVTIERVQGAIRQVFTALGGLLVSSGKITQATLDTVLSVVAVLLPFLQSLLSRNKAAKVAKHEIEPVMLKK